MTLDLYQFCPCGSGKKVKFCCSRDIVHELDRVLRISRSISESETDRARRAVLVADNTLQTLKNQLRANRVRRNRLQIAAQLAHAALQKAQLDLDRTKIAAPVDGVIVRDTVEEGSFVQRGTALFTIDDTSSIEVQCSLEMGDLYWLWRQQPASSASPASGTAADDSAAAAYLVPQTAATVIYQFAGRDDLRFSWQGMLTRFEGSGLDERTRTAPCRVVVPHPREATLVGSADSQPAAVGPPALVRGMFVTVMLHLRLDTPLVRIPDETVQPGKHVWRVRDGRLARLRAGQWRQCHRRRHRHGLCVGGDVPHRRQHRGRRLPPPAPGERPRRRLDRHRQGDRDELARRFPHRRHGLRTRLHLRGQRLRDCPGSLVPEGSTPGT